MAVVDVNGVAVQVGHVLVSFDDLGGILIVEVDAVDNVIEYVEGDQQAGRRAVGVLIEVEAQLVAELLEIG